LPPSAIPQASSLRDDAAQLGDREALHAKNSARIGIRPRGSETHIRLFLCSRCCFPHVAGWFLNFAATAANAGSQLLGVGFGKFRYSGKRQIGPVRERNRKSCRLDKNVRSDAGLLGFGPSAPVQALARRW
jgi:hypothetical protein